MNLVPLFASEITLDNCFFSKAAISSFDVSLSITYFVGVTLPFENFECNASHPLVISPAVLFLIGTAAM